MAHIVDLPNGQQAEFPDEMKAEEISSIIQKQFPANTSVQSSEQKPQIIDTFLGKMPMYDQKKELSPERMNEMINSAILSMPMAGGGLLNPLRNMISNPLLKNILNFANKPLTGAAVGAASTPDNPLAGGIIGGAIGSVPNAFNAGKKIIGIGKNTLIKVIPEDIGKAVQSGHDILKKSAENIFEDVGKQVIERKVPNFPVKTEIIDQIATHLPKTEATEKLLTEASSGNYQALRDLQTELFERGTKAIKNPLPSESNKGEEILDLRNKINKIIFNHLKENGHKDLALSLGDAMSKYRNLQKIYYAKKLSPAIKNMVHEESREIPKNIAELMNVESVPIDRILKHNPSVFDLAQQYSKNKNALKQLKYIGAGLGGLGIIGGLANVPGAIGKARDIFGE